MTEPTNEPIEKDSGDDDIQELLDQAERERDQFKSIAARAQADLVNYRRRVDDEKSEIRRNAKAGILTKVLSSLDDLDRAMELIPENAQKRQKMTQKSGKLCGYGGKSPKFAPPRIFFADSKSGNFARELYMRFHPDFSYRSGP